MISKRTQGVITAVAILGISVLITLALEYAGGTGDDETTLYSGSEDRLPQRLPVPLTNEEIKLAARLSVPVEAAHELRAYSKNPLELHQPLADAYIDSNAKAAMRGVVGSLATTLKVVKALRKKYRGNGLLFYVCDVGLEEGPTPEPAAIALLCAEDPLVMLQVEGTTGNLGGPSTEEIREKMVEWQRQYDIVLLGAGIDWVGFDFETPLTEPVRFAKEAEEFCPDLTAGLTIRNSEQLAAKIVEDQGLMLWWD